MTISMSDGYNLFHEGIQALSRAQQQGMRIDVDYCEKQKEELTQKINDAENEFKESQLYAKWLSVYGVKTNLNSPTQLSHILYKVYKIRPPKFTEGGQGSTDNETLARLNIPGIDSFLQMKKLIKVRDTYIEAFLREQVDGFLHPFFNLHTTKTFRSCLAKGTKILVPAFTKAPLSTFGYKEIQDIVVGDKVWCYDFVLKEFIVTTVKWAGITGRKEVGTLQFKGANGDQNNLRITGQHEIWVSENRWMEARHVGRKSVSCKGIRFRYDSKRQEIFSEIEEYDCYTSSFLVDAPKRKRALKDDVYDIEVEHPDHNFIANNMIVHNSSERINFQNIPKRDYEAMSITRGAIFPRKGFQIMESDYSSVEVKISVVYNKDPVLRKYVEDPTTDMHGDMAEQIFLIDKLDKHNPGHKILRQAAKNGFVFPQFYGDYYVNCAENAGHKWGGLPKSKWKNTDGIELEPGFHLGEHLRNKGIKSFSAFTEHMKQIETDFWGRRFKVYQEWKDAWWEEYQSKGYIELKTGFRKSGIMNKRECINVPIQGTAFHCLLWSFTQIDKRIRDEKLQTRLIGQIHDSVVLDIHPSELAYVQKMVRQISCFDIRDHWKWINVPLGVDFELCPVDASWREKKEVE